MRLTEYFDYSFIINLPDRKDRYRETIAEFRSVGMPLQEAGVSFFPAVKCEEAAGFPNAGARGCFLSHMAVMQRAIEGKARNVLIMEDDIAFYPRKWEYESVLVDQIKKERWDILYIGYRADIGHAESGSLLPYAGQLITAHCYALNGTIMKQMLTFMQEVLKRPAGHPNGGPMHYDGAIQTFRDQNPDVVTLLHVPALAYQRSSRTDVHPLRWMDQYPVIRALTAIARGARNRLRRYRNSKGM